MKKKGFTLVELLAVIVILAIIALITVPLIGNVIEKAKIGALESSVNGLVESANMYYTNEIIKGEKVEDVIFDFENGIQTSDNQLSYNGKVYNGKLILHATGEVAVCVDDTEHYAYKNKDTDEIVSGTGTCLYDGTTGDFSSNNSSINDLRGETLAATDITESEDGLNALIKIPEEGLYDKNSTISVPISEINKDLYTGMPELNEYFYGNATASHQTLPGTVVLPLVSYLDYSAKSNNTYIIFKKGNYKISVGGSPLSKYVVGCVTVYAYVNNELVASQTITPSESGNVKSITMNLNTGDIIKFEVHNSESNYYYMNYSSTGVSHLE